MIVLIYIQVKLICQNYGVSFWEFSEPPPLDVRRDLYSTWRGSRIGMQVLHAFAVTTPTFPPPYIPILIVTQASNNVDLCESFLAVAYGMKSGVLTSDQD